MHILEEIGLSAKEAEIYKLLLSLGESKFSLIQKELSVHPQIVYRCLHSLSEKGLVSIYKKRNVFHAIAENPQELLRIEQSRLDTLKGAIAELVELQKKSDAPIVKTSQGSAALRALRERAYQTLRKGDILYVLGGSGDRFYSETGERFRELETKRIKKGIRKKLISHESERGKFSKDSKRELTEYKFLSDDSPILSSINIFGNVAATVIWSETPIVITIENESLAHNYKDHFRHLWQVASW